MQTNSKIIIQKPLVEVLAQLSRVGLSSGVENELVQTLSKHVQVALQQHCCHFELIQQIENRSPFYSINYRIEHTWARLSSQITLMKIAAEETVVISELHTTFKPLLLRLASPLLWRQQQKLQDRDLQQLKTSLENPPITVAQADPTVR